MPAQQTRSLTRFLLSLLLLLQMKSRPNSQLQTVKRVLRRARAAHRPKDPQTLEELIIDGQWSQTAAEQPANFLQYDNGPEGMTYLKDNAPDEALPLLNYFDATYVTVRLRPHRPRAQAGLHLRFRRIPPLFPPAQWNMHHDTLSDQPRTNNVAEGWNNKFHSLVGQNHLSIWKLIECLQTECARVSCILAQDERGIRPKKRTKKVHVELQTRLRHLCQDRSSGQKSIPELLRGVSHNLRGGQPNI
ncbi:hypothetical protein ACOMHN_021256 [Nucella lapillus]